MPTSFTKALGLSTVTCFCMQKPIIFWVVMVFQKLLKKIDQKSGRNWSPNRHQCYFHSFLNKKWHASRRRWEPLYIYIYIERTLNLTRWGGNVRRNFTIYFGECSILEWFFIKTSINLSKFLKRTSKFYFNIIDLINFILLLI